MCLTSHRSLNQVSQGEATALYEAPTPLDHRLPASVQKRSDVRNAISDVTVSRYGFEVTRALHGFEATSTIQ
jgi:hypothetical protein